MIQKIIRGIADALKAAFPEVKAYKEQIKQGLTEPCFILQLLDSTNKQFLGKRYYRTNLFSVQYIPESDKDAKAECYGITENLYQVLEYITIDGDLLRGTEMRGEYFDGIMSFFVNYNMFIDIESETEPMETLTIENYVE